MLVFWWQGKGYLTIVIWMITMILFGLALALGKPFLSDGPWYWGLAFIVAALVNWHKGSGWNARKLAKVQPKTVKGRLFYKAPHRFMSLPMETFSIAIALAGVAIWVHWLPITHSM
jgi:hypothetical protein